MTAAAALLLAASVVAAPRPPKSAVSPPPRKPAVAAAPSPKSVVAAEQPRKSVVAAVQDGEYRAALDLLYDGRATDAQERLLRLEAAHPDDPVPAYLQALVLEWNLEQAPESTSLDRTLLQAADRAWARADTRVRADAGDARARFARGAASGVRSRHHLFRLQRTEAAREAARMREDLRAARALDPGDADVLFGLGLYDYYVDVLPRAARLLRFLGGLPGGDRARGLAAIEEASRASVLHGVEALAQLYEIHAFYEDDAEAAATEMEGLFLRYRGWPLWGLKLAEHLRDRMGAYGESAGVARRILSPRGEGAPDPGAGALALARLSLGQSLLLDLRVDEARRELARAVPDGAGPPALRAAADVMIGRCLEIEGDPAAAALRYRAAAEAGDREWRRRAKDALSHPLSAAEAGGRRGLGRARRAREGGRREEAAVQARAVLAQWPESREAALMVAEADLRAGDGRDARVPEIDAARDDEPPWLPAWSRLLRAQKADLAGRREEAVLLYKKVYAQPWRRADLRTAAAAGLRAAFRGPGAETGPAARRPSPP